MKKYITRINALLQQARMEFADTIRCRDRFYTQDTICYVDHIGAGDVVDCLCITGCYLRGDKVMITYFDNDNGKNDEAELGLFNIQDQLHVMDELTIFFNL